MAGNEIDRTIPRAIQRKLRRQSGATITRNEITVRAGQLRKHVGARERKLLGKRGATVTLS